MRAAAVDIGANSIRLLVAEVGAGRITRLQRRSVVTHLGEGLEAIGHPTAEATDRTVEVLSAFRAAVAEAGVVDLRAVATSVGREAADRGALMGRFGKALGVVPEVVSGDEEARLSFRGAVGAIGGEGPHLVIDPGGGTTEFAFGTGAPAYLVSIRIGSRRLADRLGIRPPIGLGALQAATAAVADEFGVLRLPGIPATVVGVGGTYSALAAVLLDLPAYDEVRVHGSVLTLTELEGLAERLAPMSLEQIAGLGSVDPERASLLATGAVVAAEALRVSGRPEVVVSEAGLLEGLLARMLDS